MNNLRTFFMLTRLIFLYIFLVSMNALADTNKTLSIYHDADYSLNQLSAQAMKMGLLTAFDEVNNEVQGFRLALEEKNHRGNIKRSLLSMKDFLDDENALFILGGLHSPPYIKNRTFINENQIPLLVPWAAGGLYTCIRPWPLGYFSITTNKINRQYEAGSFFI
ncbi:MAG: branched-chain amino acid transport system substrate-binding protein [Alteromonadaceae bacterium]|jgi:branched-chain amino acid transport system substrate-binding protein